MKPTAVQFPQSLTIVWTDFARPTAKHGAVAYALSLILAVAVLAGSVFYREIADTFGRELGGVRVATLWQLSLYVAGLVWLGALGLGLVCLSQKGRARTLGAYSIAVNIAAALLVACTVI
jgi:hypothetical protein